MADFRITSDGVLVGYHGSGGAVIVPSSVYKIGWAAFRNMTSVTTVTLPSTVTVIERDAFAGCTQLAQINNPPSLQFVGINAFVGTALTSNPQSIELLGTNLIWLEPQNRPTSISSYNVYRNGTLVKNQVGKILSIAQYIVLGVTNKFQVAAVNSSGAEGFRSAIIEYAMPAATPTTFSWSTTTLSLSNNASAMSAGGTRLFAVGSNFVKAYDISSSGNWISAPDVSSTIGGDKIAASADGRTIATSTSSAVNVFSEDSGSWSRVANLSGNDIQSIASIALSADGNTLAIGCPSVEDGRVVIYQLVNGTWTFVKSLYGEEGSAERFGNSVALSANGATLAVGAPEALGDGAVRVFTGSQWIIQETLSGTAGSLEGFGSSIAFSADGTTLVVGAPYTGTTGVVGSVIYEGGGSASVWRVQDGAWSRQKLLYGTTNFGNCVAISADGSTVAIANPTNMYSVHATNGTDWPCVGRFTGSANTMALSATGDKVVINNRAVIVSNTYRSAPLTTFPSISTLLRATVVQDASSAIVAARSLVSDIETAAGPGCMEMTADSIRRFGGTVAASGARQPLLATLLIASNLLKEGQNVQKSLLYSECIGALEFPSNEYIAIDSAFIAPLVQSIESANRISSYLPDSFSVYFPSTTEISTNTAYPNVMYCLTPGVDYTIDSVSVNYQRHSNNQQFLLSLPGGSSFVPPQVPLFSKAAVTWRMSNCYGLTALTSLPACAEHWQRLITASPSGPSYVTLAWLSADLLLSNDVETREIGRVFAQKYLPYARGYQRVVQFNNGGADANLEIIPTGYFVGAADGSIAFPSQIILTHNTTIKQIEPGAFDEAITSIVFNETPYTVQGGDIVLPGADATTVWSVNLNGATVLLPNAPAHTPTNGVINLPASVAIIPAGYFANAVASYVNFAVCSGATLQTIGKDAFPTSSKIIVGGDTTKYHTYNSIQLVRLGGIFYSNFAENPTRVWYPSPLVTLDNRVNIPPRSTLTDVSCSTVMTFVVMDDAAADTFVWKNRFVDSTPLINNTTQAHTIEFGNGTYTAFRESSNGANIQLSTADSPAIIKLLSTYHRKDANTSIEGFNSDLNSLNADASTALVIPHSTIPFKNTINAAVKDVRYRFQSSSLGEGQTFYHGNVAWVNSRVTGESRVAKTLTTAGTGGTVYLQNGAFSLYPHMFSAWKRNIRSICESDGFNLDASAGIPAFAFKDCENLTGHAFVFDSFIGASAFENCKNLSSMYSAYPFPGTVTTKLGNRVGQTSFAVGARAFKDCVMLDNILIDSKVSVTIGDSAFAGCQTAASITVDSSGSVVIGDSSFLGCSNVSTITLRSKGAVTIGANAFRACATAGPTRLLIDCSGAVNIAANAFQGCTGLYMVEIITPGAVTIGTSAFTGCATAGPARLLIDRSGAVNIGANAFQGCTGLCAAEILGAGTVTVGTSAFSGCATTALMLNETTSRTGQSVQGYLQITSSGTVTIGTNAFNNCVKLGSTSIQTTGSLTIGASAFAGCFVLGAGPAAVGLTLAGSSTTIDASAFSGCTNFQAISVANLASANPFRFLSMTGLQTLYMRTATRIQLGLMNGMTALQSVDLSGAELDISANQFQNCSSLQTLRIGNPLTGMSSTDVAGCSSLSVLALHFKTGVSCSINALTTSPITSLQITGGSTLTVPAGFCSNRTNLTNASIVCNVLRPTTGSQIITNPFSGCSTLASLSITETSGTAATLAFANGVLPALVSVRVAGNITVSIASPGTSPFWNNSVLETFDIRGRLSVQLGTVFSGKNIRTINVTNILSQGIAPYAFAGCAQLESFNVTNITGIGDGAFFGCTKLQAFNFSSTITDIGDLAFANSGISGEVVIPASVVGLGKGYFVGCPNLTRITYNGNVMMFVDPTRLTDSLWNHLLYVNDVVTRYDVSGSATITKGTDASLNIVYLDTSGTQKTVANSTLFKNMSLENFNSRTAHLNVVVQRVMNCQGENPDISGSWLGELTWKLKSLARKAASTKAVLPASDFAIAGWNGSQFTAADASANALLNSAQKQYYYWKVYNGTELAAYYKQAIVLNNNLFPTSGGTISTPVAYTLPDLNVKLQLQQSKIVTVRGTNRIRVQNGITFMEWTDATIQLEDNTLIAVPGTLRRQFVVDASSSMAIMIKWLADNMFALMSPNSTSIRINGPISSIENIDTKDSATIDISCDIVTIHQFAMCDLSNSTVNITCGKIAIDNNAFNNWYISNLNLTSNSEPYAGTNIFMGSYMININSNKFLINTPEVKMIDIADRSLQDVSSIIFEATGVEEAKTRNVRIGTFMPETDTPLLASAYTYIEFQELPSLKIYYLLQKPEDWFWLCYNSPYGSHVDQNYTEGSLQFLTDNANIPGISFGNTFGERYIEEKNRTGLVHNFSPTEFSFAGYRFTRSGPPITSISSVEQPTTVRALLTSQSDVCHALWLTTPGGATFSGIFKMLIGLAISLVLGILTLGVGLVVGPYIGIAVAVVVEVGGVFLSTALSNVVTKGSFTLGTLGVAFWIEIAAASILAPLGVSGAGSFFRKVATAAAVTESVVAKVGAVAVSELSTVELKIATATVGEIGETIMKSTVVNVASRTRREIVPSLTGNQIKQVAAIGTRKDIKVITTQQLKATKFVGGHPKVSSALAANRGRMEVLERNPYLDIMDDHIKNIVSSSMSNQISKSTYTKAASSGGWFSSFSGINRNLNISNVRNAMKSAISGRNLLPRRGLTRSADNEILEDLYVTMLFDEDQSSVSTQAGLINAVISKYPSFASGNGIKLRNISAYNSLVNQYLYGSCGMLGNNITHTDTYVDMFVSATGMTEPPFVLPLPWAPRFSTDSNEGAIQMIHNFMGRGTNFDHPILDRGINGYPCQVQSMANPLMTLSSNYLWKDVRLGPPTPVNVNARQKNELNRSSAPGTVVIPYKYEANSEIYLGTRKVNYSSVKQETPNLVYCGARYVTITIPDYITAVPDFAFCSTDGMDANIPSLISTVRLGRNTKTIGQKAFYRAAGMESTLNVYFYEGLTIGAEAFAFNLNVVKILRAPYPDTTFSGGDITVELTLKSDTYVYHPFKNMYSSTTYPSGSEYDKYKFKDFGTATIFKNGVKVEEFSLGNNLIMTLPLPESMDILNLTNGKSSSNVITYYAPSTLTVAHPGSGLSSNDIYFGIGTNTWKAELRTPTLWYDSSNNRFQISETAYTLTDPSMGSAYYSTLLANIDKIGSTASALNYNRIIFGTSTTTKIRFNNVPSVRIAPTNDDYIVSQFRSTDTETEIGDYAYASCEGMKSADIPETCVRIGDGAFLNCEGLRGTLRLPTGLLAIGANAFSGTHYSEIVIPHTVTEVGEYAFPEGASVTLLADADKNITPAVAEIFAQLTESNTVFVPSMDAMMAVMPFMEDVPVRLESEPLAPVNLVAHKKDGIMEVSWDAVGSRFAAPASSFTVQCEAADSTPVVFQNVSSPFRFAWNNNEAARKISVTARNGAGENKTAIEL
jgi:hypothetical protein